MNTEWEDIAKATADIDAALAILGKYSRRNAALILVQAEERGRDIPAAVAGFHEWRKLGRAVRKGSKGYLVWAPATGKKADTDTEDTGTPRGFVARFVFDVADTDPTDTPTEAPSVAPTRSTDERLALLSI